MSVCFVDIGGIVDHHCLTFFSYCISSLDFMWFTVVEEIHVYFQQNEYKVSLIISFQSLLAVHSG